MAIIHHGMATNANGGTELMARKLEQSIDKQLLDQFDIYLSRVEQPLNPEKINIFWAHDLPTDPQAQHALKNNNFDRYVFVSNWQMQLFNMVLQTPFQKSIVIYNGIDPIDVDIKKKTKRNYKQQLKLIYHSTPHRGLQLLVPVFNQLKQKYPQITLDVFSSFELYGWSERDKEYEQLFDLCKNSDGITYHGTKTNEEVRAALADADIFPFPSIWLETFCICLAEAMSAGVWTIHPNIGALIETGGSLNMQYQFNEDVQDHATIFQVCLDNSIDFFVSGENKKELTDNLMFNANYANLLYNWEHRKLQWEQYLSMLVSQKENIVASRTPNRPGVFTVNTYQ